ncbi:MAG TPA: hypothetical protein HPQ04_02210 [Rhodospirillaceae bacterium]|nr:hypothetical protein [Rhodospirillaceae bacterium]
MRHGEAIPLGGSAIQQGEPTPRENGGAIDDGEILPDEVCYALGWPARTRLGGAETQPGNPGRRVTTERDYVARFVKNVRRWMKLIPLEKRTRSVASWGDWVIRDLMPTLSKESWWAYRAAFVHVLSRVPEGDLAVTRLLAIPVMSAGSARKKSKDISLKLIGQEDMFHLCQSLDNGTTKHSQLAVKILLCSRMTGLRPNEWWTARLTRNDEGTALLYVVNSKYREGDRACGETRTLDLGNFAEDMVDTLAELIDELRELDDGTGETRKGIYQACAVAVNRACRRIWPRRMRHYSLYSARHSLIADLKLVYTQSEIAAIVGHATTLEAGRSYARHGGAGAAAKQPLFPPPKPSEENLALVRIHEKSLRETNLRKQAAPEKVVGPTRDGGALRVMAY